MPSQLIRIATRQSPLALWQAQHVKDLLLKQSPSLKIELLPMVTSGDQFLKDKLLLAGGKGLFVKELEEALLNQRADIAVHSTKDMPADLPPTLELKAICKRDNPLDAFISKKAPSLDALPHKAIVGTSSLRRQSQLLAYRPDLQVKTLRGNVNTRLAKLEAQEYDAIILAAAGLERLGLKDLITEYLTEQIMLPACAQGALCIEGRSHDPSIQEIVAGLNDPITSLCVYTERQVNAQLGGNCHVPLAVFCKPTEPGQLLLQAKILNEHGTQIIEDRQTGAFEKAELLAQTCVQNLLAKGGANLLGSIKL